jgi:hypothetical protein
MPILFQIEHSKALIRTKCVGNVTLEEVLAHFDELASTPNCPPMLDVLLDFSELESVPGSGDLMAVADRMRRVASRVKFGACAIVAKSDVIFGIARMYTVYAEPHFRTTRVFREFLQAEFWLQSARQNAGSEG